MCGFLECHFKPLLLSSELSLLIAGLNRSSPSIGLGHTRFRNAYAILVILMAIAFS